MYCVTTPEYTQYFGQSSVTLELARRAPPAGAPGGKGGSGGLPLRINQIQYCNHSVLPKL